MRFMAFCEIFSRKSAYIYVKLHLKGYFSMIFRVH